MSINTDMDIIKAFRKNYENCSSKDIQIIDAIRNIFADKGLDVIFDYPSLCEDLWKTVSADRDYQSDFSKIYGSGAIECIRYATYDPYCYMEKFKEAEERLTAVGCDSEKARKLLFIFYDAFGFPIRARLRNPQVIEEEKSIYVGEVKNGIRHGRGHEDSIYKGEVYYQRTGLWINGQIYGYLFSENEYGAVDHSFCIKGHMKGKNTGMTMNGDVTVHEY